MKSRCLAALAVLAALASIADCGQSKPPQIVKSSAHCAGGEYTMQCALPAPTVGSQRLMLARPAVAFGVDFAWGPPSASWMRSQGYRFGASYLSTDPSKDWSISLVNSFASAGIARVFVWESTQYRPLGGCGAGASDARAARNEAAPFHTRAIYFAVDFELSGSAAPIVESYFRCARGVLGVSHLGAYGGLYTIKRLFDAHLIHYGWQTYAWSVGAWDGRAQLEQYLNGSSYDRDRAIAADYGQTPYTTVKPRDRHAEHARLKALDKDRHKTRVHLLNAGCRVKHPRKACHPLFVHGREDNRQIKVLHGRLYPKGHR